MPIRVSVLFILFSFFFLSACTVGGGDDQGLSDDDALLEATPTPEATAYPDDGGRRAPLTCYDGVDNDQDGWIDRDDPDCSAEDGPLDEIGRIAGLACNDGIDNDGDGAIDADDSVCTSAWGESEE